MKSVAHVDVEEVERLWKEGRKVEDVAMSCGCSKSYVYMLVKHNNWSHKTKKSKYLDDIKELAMEGLTATEIAAKVGCAVQNVHGLAKLHKIELTASNKGRPSKSVEERNRMAQRSTAPMNHDRCALVRYVWGVSACASDKVCKQQHVCTRRQVFLEEYLDYKNYILKEEQNG